VDRGGRSKAAANDRARRAERGLDVSGDCEPIDALEAHGAELAAVVGDKQRAIVTTAHSGTGSCSTTIRGSLGSRALEVSASRVAPLRVRRGWRERS
jgi:hypothetical protein